MRKGILQPHAREAIERGFPAAVDDLDARQSGEHAAEQLWPLLGASGIAHALRVVGVPVGATAGCLAVEAEQQDAQGAASSRQFDGAAATVDEGQLAQLVHARDGRGRPQLAGEAGQLRAVLPPPCRVCREQGVSPGRQSVRVVGDDYGATFLGLAPRADGFDVCSGEAWAAGDADGFPPAAWPGSSGAAIDTRPARTSAAAWPSLTVKRSPRRRRPVWSKDWSAVTSGIEFSRELAGP